MNKKFTIIILTFLSVLILFGCNEKKAYESTLNLTKALKEVERLTYEKNDKNIPIFYNMTSASDKEISKIYKLDKNDFDELIIKQSALYSKSNLLIMAKVKADKKELVKKQLDNYMLEYEKIWKKQSQKEYNLVVNRSFYENNTYMVYVISYDNNKVIDTITSLFEEKEIKK